MLCLAAVRDYQAIVRELIRNNTKKYVDNGFKADINALYNDPKSNTNEYSKLKWLRPNKINSLEIHRLDCDAYKNQPFKNIFNNPSVLDNAQGSCGNCWFISALTLLGQHEGILNEIFLISYYPQYEHLKYGLCQLKLCIKGKFKIITIDDNLVCRLDNRPNYGKIQNNQLWTSLIEKALAKENKNYENLGKGNLSEGILKYS